MGRLIDDIIALDDAASRCIPQLAQDPVLRKCEFEPSKLCLVDVEFHPDSGQKVVVLHSCGPLNDYIAEVLKELLAEEGFDAGVTFRH